VLLYFSQHSKRLRKLIQTFFIAKLKTRRTTESLHDELERVDRAIAPQTAVGHLAKWDAALLMSSVGPGRGNVEVVDSKFSPLESAYAIILPVRACGDVRR
jgi:hypothetical protein